MAKPILNTSTISKKKELDPNLVGEAKDWMETVMGVTYTDFFEDIRDGVELCKLLNKIKPGTCKEGKFKKSKVVFVARTNIQIFIEGCKKLGIPETDCFETRDLFDQQNLPDVINNLYAVSAISRKHGFGGPFIGKGYAEKNKRNFSAEVLAKSKSAIPEMAQGGIYNKTEDFDGYGIVKTKKEMQNPSTVQGAWDKGSNAMSANDFDGYGIVKTAKDMQNPSAVQGVWDKGGKQVDSSNFDSYGVVKTSKDMQNPSAVQGKWDKGGNEVQSNNFDSYGVVKGPQN